MRKKCVKMTVYVLIIMIIYLMINPLPSYSIDISKVDDAIDEIGDLIKSEDPTKKYFIENAIKKFILDSKFEKWVNNMLDVFEAALPSHNIIETDGNMANVIASNLSKDYCYQAMVLTSYIERDLPTLVEFSDNVEHRSGIAIGWFDKEFINFGDLAAEFGDLIKKVGLKTFGDIVGSFWNIPMNTTNIERILFYRSKLLHRFGVTELGDLIGLSHSAYLNYKTAYYILNNDTSKKTSKKYFDSVDTKKNYDADEIKDYFERIGYNFNSNDSSVITAWCNTLGEKLGNDNFTKTDLENYAINVITGKGEESIKKTVDELNAEDAEEQEVRYDPDKNVIFKQPENTTAVAEQGEQGEQGVEGVEKVISDADKFLEDGNVQEFLVENEIQEFSRIIYSMLLGIGIVIAVIIGMIIGIKLMIAPVGEKAEAKKLLVPYVVGCVIIFGGFGIWQLVISIVESI